MGLIPGFEDSLEKSTEIHSRLLAWRIPWTEEPSGLHTVHRVTQSQMLLERLSTHTRMSYHIWKYMAHPQAYSAL